MENEELDIIIMKYYRAKNSLNNVHDGIDVEFALRGIDNAFELAVKKYYNITKEYVKFPKLLNKLHFDKKITLNQKEYVHELHNIRNAIYHNPEGEVIDLSVRSYCEIFENLVSKLFNREQSCLIFPIDKNSGLIKRFFRDWKMIKQNLIQFYNKEYYANQGYPYPPNDYNSGIYLLNYQQLIDDDDNDLLENVKNLTESPCKSKQDLKEFIKKNVHNLKKIKQKIREEIMYFYIYYDQRIR